jgi:hypothetical protein
MSKTSEVTFHGQFYEFNVLPISKADHKAFSADDPTAAKSWEKRFRKLEGENIDHGILLNPIDPDTIRVECSDKKIFTSIMNKIAAELAPKLGNVKTYQDLSTPHALSLENCFQDRVSTLTYKGKFNPEKLDVTIDSYILPAGEIRHVLSLFYDGNPLDETEDDLSSAKVILSDPKRNKIELNVFTPLF